LGTVLYATSDGPRWYNGLTLSGAGTNDSPYLATFNGNISISGGITFDDSDTYGDEYTPIYWNNGVPTAIDVVQKINWTINNGDKSVKITANNTGVFTSNSIIVQLVVTSGETNVNAPLTWASGAGFVAINTSVGVSGAVSGYILVARGVEYSEAGAENNGFIYSKTTSE
jgi:hypothetical protein